MKEKRGGKRTASEGKSIGRPKGEPTNTISFRVPAAKKEFLQQAMAAHLQCLLKQYITLRSYGMVAARNN